MSYRVHPPARHPRQAIQFALCSAVALLLCFQPSGRCAAQEGKAIERVRDVELARARVAETVYLSVNVEGHIAPVRALAFTPDSKRLCSAGHDKIVNVWRLPDEGVKAIERIRFPDADQIKKERSVRWEIARGLRGTVMAVSIAPDNGALVFGGFGARGSLGEIVWADPLDGSIKRTAYNGHRQTVAGLAHAANGRWLVSSDVSGRVLLWKRGDPVPQEIHRAKTETFDTLPVAAVGSTHVVMPHYLGLLGERRIRRWQLRAYNVATGEQDAFATEHYGHVTALAGSRDGTQFASGDAAGNFYLNQLEDGRWMRKLHLKSAVSSLAFSDDGRILAVGTMRTRSGGAPQVLLFNTRSLTRMRTPRWQTNQSVTAVAISPDRRWLAHTGSDSHDVYLKRLDGRGEPKSIGGATYAHSLAPVNRAGDYRVAFRSSGGAQKVFDPRTLKLGPGPPRGASLLHADSFAGDWDVAVGDDRLRLNVSRRGRPAGAVRFDLAGQGRIESHSFIAYKVDGRVVTLLAVGTDRQNGIYVYRLAEDGRHEMVRYLRGHSDRITSLGTSPDGRYLISSSADGTIRYWRLEGIHQRDPLQLRWGAKLEPRGEVLRVSDVVDSGPLYSKGVRGGDEIVKIDIPISQNRNRTFAGDGRDLRAALQTTAWDTQVAFTIRRDGEVLPRFNLVGGWNYYLAVFAQGDDWVAWNPSGYFASSSPRGEGLIGWHKNREHGTPPLYFPAERFADEFHQPAVIKSLLSAGTLAEAHRVADTAAADEPSPPTVVDALPPAVEILDPKVERGVVYRLEEGTITLRARATALGPRPVHMMEIYVDGRPYKERSKGIGRERKEKEEEFRLVLPDGRHRIKVRASVLVGDEEIHNFSNELLVDVADKKTQPQLHVLAIGISDYPDEALKLRFAHSDAEWLADTLTGKARGLYELGTVQVLTDRDATHEKIDSAFRRLSGVMDVGKKRGDVTVVFYSGHGWKDDREQFYFFNVDGDRERISETCFSGEALVDHCQNIPGNLILLIDACHSGAAEIGAVTRISGSLHKTFDREQNQVFMLTSSTGEEQSFEHDHAIVDRNGERVKIVLGRTDKPGAGYFTHALVNGILGEADYTNDEEVDVLELALYTTKYVPQLSGEKQNPLFKTLSGIDVTLATLKNRAAE